MCVVKVRCGGVRCVSGESVSGESEVWGVKVCEW